MLDALRARTPARASGSGSLRCAERLTIDVDATLITAHSEKENAAGNYKHGYGFHPLGPTRIRPARRWRLLRPGTPVRTPRLIT